MSYSSRHYRPALKSSTDVQLQTAFSDGNWQSVIRLADKRAKSLQDPYYNAIKICAEAQLDAPTEKYAVLFAVDDMVRKGAVVKDIDIIELYEWACADIWQDVDFSETFGVLRLRWLKANPKSHSGLSCLETCLHHWDLVNAQQIAAILDKVTANSNDRRFMFWSIILTFLLSISPQCPEGKQKLYSLLSLKQLERAAETTAKAKPDDIGNRGLRTEEEFYLYYRVLATHGSKEDFVKQILDPELGAMKQFKQGRKYLFLEALDAFESQQKWDELYGLCRQALSHRDEDGLPSYLAADWRVWKAFIAAASKEPDSRAAFEEVQGLLRPFVSTKTKVAQMYKKNIALALLETSFRIPKTLLPENAGPGGLTQRVTQICLFLDQNYDRLSAFDDLKVYVAELTFGEAKYFVEEMIPKLAGNGVGTLKEILMKVLELKFRYLLTTCPQTYSELPTVFEGKRQVLPYRCRVCSEPASSPCEECLRRILLSAVATHGKINAEPSYVKSIPELDKDPRLDLSMLVGLCLLKLGGMHRRISSPSRPPLRGVDTSNLLQAILVLDTQLRDTPDDTGLRLLLVQLYLLLGCSSYAYQLWATLDVKRTIQDALSPLFFDRISTLSPGLFQGNRPLMEPLRSYYSTTLRDQCPLRIWDAFSSGSYSSVLDMVEYDSRLRRSCTLVMTVVEERRAMRAIGGRFPVSIDEDPLIAKISDTTELVNPTDYGSFTNMESKHSDPIQDLVRLGPALSSARSHLSLLTAQLLDTVTYKPPKDYKPSKSHDVLARDHVYNIEMLSRIHNSATTILHSKSTPECLTSGEHSLFTVTALLSGLLATSLVLPRSSSPLPASTVTSVSALKATLATLRTEFLSGPPSGSKQSDLFASLTNMHTLSSLLEAALATRHSAAFVLTWNEREVARDRSGRSGCHKDILAEMKALDVIASKALGDVKARIKTLKERLAEGGWLDRLLGWTFGTDEQEQADEIASAVTHIIGGRHSAEEWAGRILESWIENIKGWANVKME